MVFDILRLKGDAPDENHRQRESTASAAHLPQLASAPPGEPHQRCRNCASGGLSCPYVEKLLWTLKKAGWFHQEPPRGQRRLRSGETPEQISLGDVEEGARWPSGRRRTSAIAIRANVGLVSRLTRTAPCVRSGRASQQYRCGGDETAFQSPRSWARKHWSELSLGKTFRPPAQVYRRSELQVFLGAKHERFVRYEASDVGSATALNLERRYHGH